MFSPYFSCRTFPIGVPYVFHIFHYFPIFVHMFSIVLPFFQQPAAKKSPGRPGRAGETQRGVCELLIARRWPQVPPWNRRLYHGKSHWKHVKTEKKTVHCPKNPWYLPKHPKTTLMLVRICKNSKQNCRFCLLNPLGRRSSATVLTPMRLGRYASDHRGLAIPWIHGTHHTRHVMCQLCPNNLQLPSCDSCGALIAPTTQTCAELSCVASNLYLLKKT